ncbi:MAG: hypothetical protein Roseis2KO_07510 [Roseivirga sp.]
MSHYNKKRGVFIGGTFLIVLLIGWIFRGKLQTIFDNETKTFVSGRFSDQYHINPIWLDQMGLQQQRESENYDLFHDFKFDEKGAESGIDFLHKINPDAGKDYKAVHYDHGNGLVAADVNLDGHLDILFVSLAGPVGLFINNGEGQFSEVTQAAGLGLTGTKTCISASFGDIDNDGDPDLYISTIRDGNFLFENDGKGKFTDISKMAGVDYRGHSSGVVFLDYDADGLLDIFVTNIGVYSQNDKKEFVIEGEVFDYYEGVKDGFAGHLKEERFEPSKLYHNVGDNRFEEVAELMGIRDMGWCGDASIIDPNQDGYPDLYVTNMQGNDIYYENNKGQSFIDKTALKFPKTPWGAMGITVFDLENDGLQDIYITDMHSDMLMDVINDDFGREKKKASVDRPESYLLTEGMSIFGNAFYRALEDESFEEISDQINAENYWPWGLSNADLNADGFEDVFIASSMNYPYRYATNTVLLNEKGRGFRNSEFILGIEPRTELSKPWFTLDCSVKDRERVACRGKQGEVTIWGSNGSRSSLIFDLDGDGDLDIVTNEFNNSPQVLISDLSSNLPNLSYLKIKLVGVQSNRDGIGAKVVVETEGNTYTKLVTGKSGYLSQSSLPLYFGLNGASEVKKITVKWPSGSQQELVNPDIINDLLIINEQAGE